MFKYLLLLSLISCATNQNSKIYPIPQNVTKNKNQIEQNKVESTSINTKRNSNKNIEKAPTQIFIPIDTSKVEKNMITQITISNKNDEKIEKNNTSDEQIHTNLIESKKVIKSTSSTPKKVKTSIISGFKVQVGAFKDIASAEKKKYEIEKKLKESGIIADSFVVVKGGLYKVVIGDYNNRKKAKILKASLSTININGFIVK